MLSLLPAFLLCISALNPVSAQTTFDIESFANALRTAGFTQAANLTYSLNSTVAGQQLLAELSNGNNYTFFVPIDEAFNNVSSYMIVNNETITQYISYHFLSGDLRNTTADNTTVGGSGGGSTSTEPPPSTSAVESATTITDSATTTEPSASTSTVENATTITDSASTTEPPTDTSTTVEGATTATTDSATETATSTASELYNVFHRPVFQSNGSSTGPKLQSMIYPEVTLGQTLLYDSYWADLPCHQPQELAWTKSWELGNVTFLNQKQNITVVNSTQYQNISIYGITGFLIPPGNFSTALTAINATEFQNFIDPISMPNWNGSYSSAQSIIQSIRGVTIFVPNNDAFTAAQEQLQDAEGNDTAIAALLTAHIVDYSTVLYTDPLIPQMASTNQTVTNANGRSISFVSNDTGLYVLGQNDTSAKIVRPDVLIMNGVIQVIDRVLINTDYNPKPTTTSTPFPSVSTVAVASSETTTVTSTLTDSETTTMVTSTSTLVSSETITSTTTITPTPAPSSTTETTETSSVASSASSEISSAESAASSISSVVSSASSVESSATSAALKFRKRSIHKPTYV